MYTLPNLFKPYIEGREKAIDSNWKDMKNFNDVLGGQMQNAVYGATMGDAIDMSHDLASDNYMKTIVNAAMLPTKLGNAAATEYVTQKYAMPLADQRAQVAMANNSTALSGAALQKTKTAYDQNVLNAVMEMFKDDPELQKTIAKRFMTNEQPVQATQATEQTATTGVGGNNLLTGFNMANMQKNLDPAASALGKAAEEVNKQNQGAN